jgi:uncharacterized protein (TIGR02452 family)
MEEIEKGCFPCCWHLFPEVCAARYLRQEGVVVELAAVLTACQRDSELLKENDACWGQWGVEPAQRRFANTHVTVHDRTVLQELSAMITGTEPARLMVLNFASAKNPGGGFLNGAQAQEESLARSGGGRLDFWASDGSC